MSTPAKPTTNIARAVKEAVSNRRVSEGDAQHLAAECLWEAAQIIPLGFSKKPGGPDGTIYLPPPEADWEFWIDNALSLLRSIYGGDSVAGVEDALRQTMTKRLEAWLARTDATANAKARTSRRAFS